jgi:integrase
VHVDEPVVKQILSSSLLPHQRRAFVWRWLSQEPQIDAFHGLRHTHATLLMKHGVHPKVAAERLGHADITLTLSTSSHVLPLCNRRRQLSSPQP